MPTKRIPHTQTAETPEVLHMGAERGGSAAAQVESEFTPRVWNSITQLKPQSRPDLEKLVHQGPTFDLETKFDPRLFMEGLKRVLEALDRASWGVQPCAEVVSCILQNPYTRLQSVELWIRSHERDDSEAVCDCINLIPPADFLIMRRLPKKGSQKVVFEASWSLYQKTVILKKPLSPESVLRREMNSSPLINEHPNIIKTYILWNGKKEIFLVEDKLQKVLNDEYRTTGTAETALLVHDIASALAHLKAKNYVHGDVKPDNVGFDDDHFVLLDFGICRPANE